MKILLLGKNGQVGRALAPALAGLGEVLAWGRSDADLERPEALPARIVDMAPDVIVNAAAYTAVDRAESEPERARLVNGEAVAAIADATRQVGAWLIHYSTDYVFDGTKDGSYVETDAAAPLGVYGASKHQGDLAIAASGCRHLIFRVSWVYADGTANFARTMLRLARERDALQVVADQVGAPTSARLIAAVTATALGRLAAPEALAPGLYHLAPAGAVSRLDYVRFLVTEAKRLGADLAVTPERITPVASTAFPTPARRPLNSRLDTGKLRQALGLALPDWRDDVRPWVAGELA
jgi:dTDP-4-dehydrorhamnose reductase